METVKGVVKHRGNTKAAFVTDNPVLYNNEIAIETDTGRIKIGDQAGTAWNDLAYAVVDVSSADELLTLDNEDLLIWYDDSESDPTKKIKKVKFSTLASQFDVANVQIAEVPQCILSAKVLNDQNDALSFSGQQVTLNATAKDFICTIAGGRGLNGDINYNVNISTDQTPTEWLFSASDAADRYQLYIEVDGAVVTFGKTQFFTSNLTEHPASPVAGTQYYNRLDRRSYEYGAVWEAKNRLNIGSIDWDGSTTLSNIFNYNFEAVTKYDYTKRIGSGEYAFLQGYEQDTSSLFPHNTTGEKDLSPYLPKNAVSIINREKLSNTTTSTSFLTAPASGYADDECDGMQSYSGSSSTFMSGINERTLGVNQTIWVNKMTAFNNRFVIIKQFKAVE